MTYRDLERQLNKKEFKSKLNKDNFKEEIEVALRNIFEDLGYDSDSITFTSHYGNHVTVYYKSASSLHLSNPEVILVVNPRYKYLVDQRDIIYVQLGSYPTIRGVDAEDLYKNMEIEEILSRLDSQIEEANLIELRTINDLITKAIDDLGIDELTVLDILKSILSTYTTEERLFKNSREFYDEIEDKAEEELIKRGFTTKPTNYTERRQLELKALTIAVIIRNAEETILRNYIKSIL